MPIINNNNNDDDDVYDDCPLTLSLALSVTQLTLSDAASTVCVFILMLVQGLYMSLDD